MSSLSRKKLRKRSKSNKETPKNYQVEGLTTLRACLDYSLEFRYCFLSRKSGISRIGKHEMCHKIGQFSSRNPPVDTVLEVLRSNRRNRTNGAKKRPFLTHLFPEIYRKRREGKGVRKVPEKSRQEKQCKKHAFQGPALFSDSGGQE